MEACPRVRLRVTQGPGALSYVWKFGASLGLLSSSLPSLLAELELRGIPGGEISGTSSDAG